MKKLIILSTGIVSLAAVGFIVAPVFAENASGNSNGYGYQQAITSKATALGMTEAELKTQLQSKTMLQVAQDKGISEDQFHEKMQTAAQARWKTKGLTQAEIDSRLANMKARQANCDGEGQGAVNGTGGGMHGNRINR